MPAEVPADEQAGYDTVVDNVYLKLLTAQPELRSPAPVRRMNTWMKYAAAVVLILVAGGSILLPKVSGVKADSPLSNANTPIQPVTNTNKAILILGNGKQINLESSSTGQLAQQNGSSVTKPEDGQLVYENNNAELNSDAVEFNTVSTPRGGNTRFNYQMAVEYG